MFLYLCIFVKTVKKFFTDFFPIPVQNVCVAQDYCDLLLACERAGYVTLIFSMYTYCVYINIKNGEFHILPFRHQFLSQLEGNGQTKTSL